MAYNSETDKIDKQATDGLAGTPNSLAYRVHEIEKHFHGEGSWFGAAIEQGGYEIAGTTSPDFDGTFLAVGSLNGDFYYQNKDGDGFLWWDGVDTWVVSAVADVTGTDYFSRTDASPIGAYTNQGSATGTVTGADVADEDHVGDRIGPGVVAFQLDAGNDDWGTWVQVLGTEDTPARASQAYFDPHEIVITSTERAGTYFFQLTRGTSGAAGLAAGTYTEFVYESDSVGAKAAGITAVQTGRAPAGSKLWARTLCVGETTATIDFYMGIHEYAG